VLFSRAVASLTINKRSSGNKGVFKVSKKDLYYTYGFPGLSKVDFTDFFNKAKLGRSPSLAVEPEFSGNGSAGYAAFLNKTTRRIWLVIHKYSSGPLYV